MSAAPSDRLPTLYADAEGVERYVSMAADYDGADHVAVLAGLLPEGASVLELGMGPGKDLDMLSASFEAVGSDLSQSFLDRYAATHPEAELHLLDAVTIAIDGDFDGIYSNKVLHHLDKGELAQSLVRQHELLRPGGILLHTLWRGDGTEEYDGMFVQNHTCEGFAALIPPGLELVECVSYAEMEEDDSLRVVLRRQTIRDVESPQ